MPEKNVDIVIIGLGVAGFSAAIAAAEEGKQVLLIEKSNAPGGNATQSNVGTICGAFYRSSSTLEPVQHSFLQRVVQSIGKQPLDYHKGLVVVPYDWKKLGAFIETELLHHNVEVWYQSHPVQVETFENTITSIEVEKEGKTINVTAKAFIDCSGNGILSQLAGLEMIRSEHYQSASQVFSLTGIDSTNEFALNFAIAKTATLMVKTEQWPEEFSSLSVVPGSLNDGAASLKFSLPEHIDDKTDPDELHNKALLYVDLVYSYLKEHVQSMQHAEIETIFPQVGMRVLQRSKGQHVLHEDEVLHCVKSEDEVAIGSWPIEEWNHSGRVSMAYFPENDFYSIPKGCLMSYQLHNLYFAGKNISATHKAIASARVIGSCIQTGYAAGKLCC